MRIVTLCSVLALATLASPQGASTASAEKIDFAKQVLPIFEARCTGCHGEKKGAAGIRVHSEQAIKEIKDEHFLVAGDPDKSELYERIALPADHKKRMPKGGKPLDAEQIEIIKSWITEGAMFTSAKAAPAEEPKPMKKEEPKAKEKPPAAASEEAIKKLDEAGASVVPLYSGSTLLSIGFPSGAADVKDDTVDLIVAVAPNVAWLDLGGTGITDAGATKLAGMKNLERLHLEQTAVTDAAISPLVGLPKLIYLNLYGTNVTDKTVEALAKAPKLQKLYLWQTAVSYDAAKKLEGSKEGMLVNLGWDHPGVVKERLTNELKKTAERKAEAEKEAKALEKKLADAKKQLESNTAREKEIQAELEALNKPAKKKPEEKTEEKKSAEEKTEEKTAEKQAEEEKKE